VPVFNLFIYQFVIFYYKFFSNFLLQIFIVAKMQRNKNAT